MTELVEVLQWCVWKRESDSKREEKERNRTALRDTLKKLKTKFRGKLSVLTGQKLQHWRCHGNSGRDMGELDYERRKKLNHDVRHLHCTHCQGHYTLLCTTVNEASLKTLNQFPLKRKQLFDINTWATSGNSYGLILCNFWIMQICIEERWKIIQFCGIYKKNTYICGFTRTSYFPMLPTCLDCSR